MFVVYGIGGGGADLKHDLFLSKMARKTWKAFVCVRPRGYVLIVTVRPPLPLKEKNQSSI